MKPTGGNSTIDDLAIEYLRGAQIGAPPPIENLVARLPEESQRVELRALIETTEWATSTFPLPFKSQQLIADRYTLLDELGIGGFGKVWRARDEKVGRDVALKLFHSLMEPEQVASTLRRERDSLARVHHEGIVRLLDSGKEAETHFLVMELVEGKPLDAVLDALKASGAGQRPNRADVSAAIGEEALVGEESWLEDDWYRTAARITVGMLWALAAAHGQQIFHRDLKPANVVIRPNGKPVLLDFGLAGLGDQAQGTLTGRLFGTVAYMAPEQIEKMRTGKDAHTDIYQLGLLLHEMLTFQRAFGDSDRTSVLESVRRGLITSPRQLQREVPQELADICMRAVERNPERRYATADDFRKDLEKWLAGQLPSASKLGTAGRAWRGARRWTVSHRTAAAATVLVLLGAGSTAWFAAPGLPTIEAKMLVRGEYEVTTSGEGVVCAWHVALDGAGKSLGTYPLEIQVGTQKPTRQPVLAVGTTKVRIIEAEDIEQVPGTVKTDVRWFLATDQDASDWMQLIQRVAMEAETRERVVDNGRVREIHTELLASGRGAEGIGPLPLDQLLR